MPTLEVISLIYKSPKYLKFICDQFKGSYNSVLGWDVTFRLVANDATPEILKALPECGIKFDIYNDSKPEDYYLNRVYRCWNHAGKTSPAEHICFVNSDMAFSPHWLQNLVKYHDGKNIPTSRLVESGRKQLQKGNHSVECDFGRHPNDFNEDGWIKLVNTLASPEARPHGLFMPVIFNKERFIDSGMYPEGNVYHNGIGTLGMFLRSGDEYFFNNILKKKYGMQHITVYDSLVYHMQEGEMND